MRKKYLIQHQECGEPLFKTEIAIFFKTTMKCPGCKKIIRIPDDIIITLDKHSGFVKINKTK